MAPSCSSMPVKRPSTRRSAPGSPASRRDVESARAAEGPLPAAGAAVVAAVAPLASALVSPMSASPCRPPPLGVRSLCPYVAWGLRSSSLAGAEASGKNNYLIRPIGSRQPLLEAGEALQQFVKTGFFTLRERAQK